MVATAPIGRHHLTSVGKSPASLDAFGSIAVIWGAVHGILLPSRKFWNTYIIYPSCRIDSVSNQRPPTSPNSSIFLQVETKSVTTARLQQASLPAP